MFRFLKNSRRLFATIMIMAREDALFIFDELNISPVGSKIARLFRRRSNGLSKGKRLAAALERLGPAYIKLGQVLSTRSDLIGDDIADDLGSLRDNLPPFPTKIARAIIEEQLGAKIEDLFVEFSDHPVAAASIAQVHRASTKDGRDVAVKILRPGIEEAFERDLQLFFWVAEIVQRRLPDMRRLKPIEVVNTLKESVFFELDLRFEAAAATELADNITKHPPGLCVPEVDWNLTSKRVLTTQWVEGIPLSDVEAIKKAGFDVDDLLTKAANSLFAQVFKDGFFHADLHPGNLFVDPAGNLVAVDFGIMGRLDFKSRMYIAEILRGFLNEDYRHVAEVHFDAGYVPYGKSLEAFTQACMAVAKPITGKPLNEISIATLLGQMFKIAAEFEMEVQPQLLLLQKTMMVTEGVGRMLNPELNMWQLSKPLIEEWAHSHFGVTGKIKDSAQQGYEIIRKLPVMLTRFENMLMSLGDKDGIRLHPLSIDRINQGRNDLWNRWLAFAWVALVVSAAFGTAIMLK